MKITNVKAMVAKVMTVGLLAGAMVMAAPAKAQAQGFAVGVQFGGPAYYGGYDGRRDFYERQRFEQERREAIARREAWERQQAFLRHQQWEREHRFYGRDYRFYDRDDYYRGR